VRDFGKCLPQGLSLGARSAIKGGRVLTKHEGIRVVRSNVIHVYRARASRRECARGALNDGVRPGIMRGADFGASLIN